MNIQNDSPVESISSDALKRASLVDLVSKSLIESEKIVHPCRCVGIYGKWGEGKTSFMNFIKEAIKDEPHLALYDFNPWLADNNETLMWDFFNTISRDATSELKAKMRKYGGLVNMGCELVDKVSSSMIGISPVLTAVGVVGRGASKALLHSWNASEKAISGLGDLTLSERKKEISTCFVSSNQHRIIFVDDIDRLDKEEIHTVFRLIREVADFDNVTYIIAMDPDIVAKSLSSYFGEGRLSDGRSFIDKIIQVPIQLPAVQQSCIGRSIKDRLIPLWQSFASDMLEDKEEAGKFDELCVDLSKILLSQRQIIRFINQLGFVMPALKGEVNMFDLCYLEAIRCLDTQAYLRIYQHRSALFHESESKDFINNYVKEGSLTDDNYETALDEVVRDLTEPFKSVVREIVDDLFNSHPYDARIDGDRKRVCSGVYFSRYFIQMVPEGSISDFMINELYSDIGLKKVENLTEVLNGWGKEYGFKETERALEFVVRKGKNEVSQSELCQKMIKAFVHTDFVKNFRYGLLDPNSPDIFIVASLLNVYMKKKNTIMSSLVNDDDAMKSLVMELYGDEDLSLAFLMELHMGCYHQCKLTKGDYVGPLVNRFLSLSYPEQQSYSREKLWPLFEVWNAMDNNGPENYLKGALDSKEFDAQRFLCSLVRPDSPNFGDSHRFKVIFKEGVSMLTEKLEDHGVTTVDCKQLGYMHSIMRDDMV